MILHVVAQGDTIESIAANYGVSATSLILDNELDYQDSLVVGQVIVIVYPQLTYRVQEGDTLFDIAEINNVSTMSLIANNPWLWDREYIYPGDVLVISFNKIRTITTHGYAFPYMSMDTLRKTLPYLTYLSIFNYTSTEEGEIKTYYDDTEIIQMTKSYGVRPLMLLTTLSLRGEANVVAEYEIILNEDIQNIYIDNVINILETKGYEGVNVSFQYINTSNIPHYEVFYTKMVNRLNQEGYQAFATINPNISVSNSDVKFIRIDYSIVNQLAQNTIFINYSTAMNTTPPSPVSSIKSTEAYVNYLKEFIPTDRIVIGNTTVGYDWELPFYAGVSSVNSISVDNAIDLARNEGVAIQFDEESQTPYFSYTIANRGREIEHIVWFVDARSINAMLNLVVEHNLLGTSIWNIMNYDSQFWLLINSQFDIEKNK